MHHDNERDKILMPNDLGLFDMLGNVCEWCQDPYQKDQPGRKRSPFDEMDKLMNIDKVSGRILRGGSFADVSELIRSANRNWYAALGT